MTRRLMFYKNTITSVLDRDWCFTLRHNPRVKHVFENNNDIMPREEDN